MTQIMNICFSIVVLLALLKQGQTCYCRQPKHPQQYICDDVSFVMKVVVVQTYQQDVGNELYNMSSVTVLEDYKEPANNGETKEIMLENASGSCHTALTVGKCYVIAGKRASYQIYFPCSYKKLCDQLTDVEVAGFEGEYEKGCDCEIVLESFSDNAVKTKNNCIFPDGPYVRDDCYYTTAMCRKVGKGCRRRRYCDWVTNDVFKCEAPGDKGQVGS